MFGDKYKRIADYLELDRPLVVFDLETTGHAMSSDRIVKLAFIKIMPNGRVINGHFLLNPETEISPESTSIHGITTEDIKDKPSFRKKAQEIWEIFNHAYLGGFNIINFDLPLIKREFLRAGMSFEYTNKDIIDFKKIFTFLEPNTLSGAYNYYVHKDYTGANDAVADVEAASEIFEKQLKKYKEIRDIKFINEIHTPHDEDYYVDHEHKFYWLGGVAYFNFSKYKDKPLAEVLKKDRKFLEWIMEADFSIETKKIVKKFLEKEDK